MSKGISINNNKYEEVYYLFFISNRFTKFVGG
jgi:hypothetical protein